MRKAMKWMMTCAAASMILLAGSGARSDVTGSTQVRFFQSGRTGSAVLMLMSTEGAVDGINGVMEFDPAVLMNPSLLLESGSQGFTALGNEASAGVFHFVLFKNPADTSLDIANPVMTFRLEAAPDLTNSTTTTVTFSQEAAAQIQAGAGDTVVSIANVDFDSFEVFINGASARDWSLYQ